LILLLFSLLLHPPPLSSLFPYTTLFRSRHLPGRGGTPGQNLSKFQFSFEVSIQFRSFDPVSNLVSKFGTSFKNQTGVSKGNFTVDRKSTRLNSSHVAISYAVFCLKKKTN